MPVSAFTAVGSTVDATIVDGNYEKLRQYLQEQVVGGDISSDTINRWIIRNYTGGRIASATTRAKEISDYSQAHDQQNQSFHESTYRSGTGAATGVQDKFSMELLGRPGPSFYWQFQEDGVVYANAPDVNRYDPGFCYSMWLTVPLANLKIYIPEACVVRMHGRAYYLGSLAAIDQYRAGGGTIANWRTNRKTLGREIAVRLGLFADTNPNLHTDEFTNTNPNVLDPVSGAQAAYCSWKEVATKTVTSPQWQREDISGVTTLKGGRWYNFSMKYKGAGALGYRDGGADPFIDAIYEVSKAGIPNYNGTQQPMIGTPPWVMQWISTSLHLEFIYGIGTVVADTALIGNVPA